MKNNILKISTLLFSLLGLIILSSTPAFASDDNIDYTLELKLGSANDYTPARYRQQTVPPISGKSILLQQII